MRKITSTVLAMCLMLVGYVLGPIQVAEAHARPRVTLTVSPTTVPSELKTKLVVTVKSGVAGQKVAIQRRLDTKSRWTTLQTLKLSKSLTAQALQSPKLGTNYYRAYLARKGSSHAAASKQIRVTGTVLSNPVAPAMGQRVVYSGNLPTAFKRAVQLQEKRGAKWIRIAVGRTAKSGKAKLAASLSAKATLRIYAPAARYKGKKRPAFASPSLTVDPKAAGDDTKTDTDKDSLPDSIEQKLDTSSQTADTDGDGLTDQEEVVVTTDPTKKDSDGNGTPDPADDLDNDGVSNRTELADGTKAYNPDSDADGLSDGDEKSRKTHPTKADTDSDGVDDGTEIKVGSDPLQADSDGDGKADGTEAFTLEVKGPSGATFEGTGPANAVATTKLTTVTDAALQRVAGGLGAGVEVKSTEPLDSGTLTIPFDASSLPADARVGVLHFDEATGTFDLPTDQEVDLSAGQVTVRTTKFSPFVVVDLNAFEAIWKTTIVEPREGTGTSKNIDAVLALDSSGSMADNDPNDDRKVAAKLFVDALVSGDLASAIDFDSQVEQIQPLTPDFTAVKALIDSIDSNGGTDIGAPVREGLDELDRNGKAAHGRVMVLLTDGDGPYDDSLTQRAKDTNTTVYTVGLGTGVQETLLQGIADATGGKFFLVQDASNLPGAYDRITDDIGAPDTDKDGLSDEAERAGWRTQRGVIYRSDPAKADTDGDGLTDGQEAGRLLTNATWGKAYEGISNPQATDSDGDGLDDRLEVSESTNPLLADTDSDGLEDLDETEFGSDPTNSNSDGDSYNDKQERDTGHDPMVYDLTSWDSTVAVAGGFLFGDWDFGARTVGGLSNAQRQSIEYVAGQLASGYAIFGDVRDTFSNVATGNFGAAILSVVGLVPVAGDAAKTVGTITKFALKGERATKAAARVAAKLPWDITAKRKTIRAIVGADVAKARLPQDVAVRGKPVTVPNEGFSPNGQLAKISKSAAQDAELRKDMALWEARGARNVRVNQRQVDASGNYVGINRPDFQFDLNGKHYAIEYDTPLRAGSDETARGLDHYRRILANDPGLAEDQIILKPIN